MDGGLIGCTTGSMAPNACTHDQITSVLLLNVVHGAHYILYFIISILLMLSDSGLMCVTKSYSECFFFSTTKVFKYSNQSVQNIPKSNS